jgi:enoyl-CoA hydratase
MRGVKARTLTAAFSQDSKDQEHFKDMYGRFISHCGILKMNKEHKYNTLSPGFIDEVYRGVESMNQDRQARVIYLSSRKHEQWSNGTDFKHMRHMSKEENFDQVAAYIEKIYQLQTRVASMNKPIVAVATGHAWNSGATMLSACSYPMMTYNAQLAFNECTFGFVPHSGATYYLSRLPREFGTFMALTGLPIKGADAMRIGLVDNLIDSPADYEHYVAEAVEA